MTASIDKVTMFLPRTRTTPDITQYLEDPEERPIRETGEIKTFGHVRNASVICSPSGISIIGSPLKFRYGSNLLSMDVDSVGEAFEELSDMLHLDLNDARVTALEYGANLIMRNPPEVYLSKLGDMPRMRRYQYDGFKMYYQAEGKSHSTAFHFYDKGKQVGKKMLAEFGLSGANVLRVEDRLFKRVKHQLGVSEITAATLQDRCFNRLMAERFGRRYFSIRKQKKMLIPMESIKSPKDAYNAFMAQQINEAGPASVAEYIKNLRAHNVFRHKSEYNRLSEMFRKIMTRAKFCAEDEDVVELDDEIRNAISYL